jgi:hypothetical protein
MYFGLTTPTLLALRECQRRYGLPKGSTAGKWMKRCIKLRNLPALTFLLDQALNDFLGVLGASEHIARNDETSQALVCSTAGFKVAFKLGYQEAIEHLLKWNMDLHASNKNRSLHHVFYHSNSQVNLAVVLEETLHKSNGTVARWFVEKYCPDLDFTAKIDVKSWTTTTYRDRNELSYELLFKCASNGDKDNFDFFFALRQRFAEAAADKSDISQHLLIDLLQRGKSPLMFPTLVANTKYPEDWKNFDHLMMYAKQNLRHPEMLRYVISITPRKTLLAQEAGFKQMYDGAEQSFRKALGVMQTDVNSKKALKFVVRFQKRLSLCKSFLIDLFRLDWEKFRPSYAFTYQLENTSGFCHFGKKIMNW